MRKKDLSTKEKAYLIASQQYMYKDIEGFGKVSYTNEEMGEIINLSPSRIDKYDNSLIDKGYLTLIESNKKDLTSGIFIKEKFFKLNELEQEIVFALQKHDEEITNLDNRITIEEKSNKFLLNKVLQLEEELQSLRKLKGFSQAEITL